MSDGEPAWVHGHPHKPNPVAPPGDGTVAVAGAQGAIAFTLEQLRRLPFTEVDNCHIVSTGHGVSGPFRFGGVTLAALLRAALPPETTWATVDVIGADGFGARLARAAVEEAPPGRPPLLAITIDGAPMSRAQGLTRLVVPTETGDALLQIKWVERIVVHLPERDDEDD